MMSVSVLILIQSLHIRAHHKMEHDIHGVVRKYCTEKPGECAEYLPEDWLR